MKHIIIFFVFAFGLCISNTFAQNNAPTQKKEQSQTAVSNDTVSSNAISSYSLLELYNAKKGQAAILLADTSSANKNTNSNKTTVAPGKATSTNKNETNKFRFKQRNAKH